MTATQATFLFCGLLQAIFATKGLTTDLEPVFLAPLENHTLPQGRDAYFTCVVNHLGPYKVAWIKSDTKAILAIHTHMVSQNSRMSVTHNGHNTWKLRVSNTQTNDSGAYMCQINTDPMRTQVGYLKVVVPPDVLDEDDPVNYPTFAVEGGQIRLRCLATGVPAPKVHWKREDGRNIILREEGSTEKQALRSSNAETLVLANVHRTDMGSYLCIASNGVPPPVSKRFIIKVHFHPLIRVSNQLVAAPLNSDVLIQCYTEAFPRAMNHWTRDKGQRLVSNEKYIIKETYLNEYSLMMNLTIRTIDRGDFGGYGCTSINYLGKAEGVVRVQELNISTETISTIGTPSTGKAGSKFRKIHQSKERTKKPDGQSDVKKERVRGGATTPPNSTILIESQAGYPIMTTTPKTTKVPEWTYQPKNQNYNIASVCIPLNDTLCICLTVMVLVNNVKKTLFNNNRQ